jgi:hypothetical protein
MSRRWSAAVAVFIAICVGSSLAWIGSGAARQSHSSTNAHSAHCRAGARGAWGVSGGGAGVGGRGETALRASKEEYSNKVTEFLGLFLPQEKSSGIDTYDINWDVSKRRKSSLSSLAADLEAALGAREWFVTGNMDPSFFSEDFIFEDPDVKLEGVRAYAVGVNKLFDQGSSRCEVSGME